MVYFLAVVALHLLVEFWLNIRQARHVKAHRNTVPEYFTERISLAAHRKAADYTLAKLRFGLWFSVFGVGLLFIWTIGGGLDFLDGLAHGLGLSELLTGVIFISGFFMISELLTLPFSIYNTFVIEQRFGFNSMTPGLFVSDLVKQGLLFLSIGTPLTAIVLWLMQATGTMWWLWVWLIWTVFSLFMVWLYPTLIAPLFNRFSPLKDGDLKSRIETLLSRCGFESRGLYVMDGSRRSTHGNAYFTGFGRSRRIVFFDTLIKQLSHDEIEAVLAHELGHFKRRHIRKAMVVMTVLSLAGFAILGWLAGENWFYQTLGVSLPSHHTLLILFMLVLPHFTFWMTPLSSWFSRRHEFEADDYAASHSNAADLITALVRMYEDNASTLTPDALYSAWHDSHPPAPVRIANLETYKPRKSSWSHTHSASS